MPTNLEFKKKIKNTEREKKTKTLKIINLRIFVDDFVSHIIVTSSLYVLFVVNSDS